jgi:hypothetical protein
MSEKFESLKQSTEQIQSIAFKEDLLKEAGLFRIFWLDKLENYLDEYQKIYSIKKFEIRQYDYLTFNNLYIELNNLVRNESFEQIEDIIAHLQTAYISYLQDIFSNLTILQNNISQNPSESSETSLNNINQVIQEVKKIETKVNLHLNWLKYFYTGDLQYKEE